MLRLRSGEATDGGFANGFYQGTYVCDNRSLVVSNQSGQFRHHRVDTESESVGLANPILTISTIVAVGCIGIC